VSCAHRQSPRENMHNTQVQEFAEAVERGATIIVVDPRFSIAAGKAKHYSRSGPARTSRCCSPG